MKAKKPADPGPCSLQVTIQHERGGMTTANYVAPSLQLGEAIFEILTNHARSLCDAAQEIGATQSYKLIDPPRDTSAELRGSGGILFADLRKKRRKHA